MGKLFLTFLIAQILLSGCAQDLQFSAEPKKVNFYYSPSRNHYNLIKTYYFKSDYSYNQSHYIDEQDYVENVQKTLGNFYRVRFDINHIKDSLLNKLENHNVDTLIWFTKNKSQDIRVNYFFFAARKRGEFKPKDLLEYGAVFWIKNGIFYTSRFNESGIYNTDTLCSIAKDSIMNYTFTNWEKMQNEFVANVYTDTNVNISVDDYGNRDTTYEIQQIPVVYEENYPPNLFYYLSQFELNISINDQQFERGFDLKYFAPIADQHHMEVDEGELVGNSREYVHLNYNQKSFQLFLKLNLLCLVLENKQKADI